MSTSETEIHSKKSTKTPSSSTTSTDTSPTWGDKVKWWDIIPNQLDRKGIREYGIIRYMSESGMAFIETSKGEFVRIPVRRLEKGW